MRYRRLLSVVWGISNSSWSGEGGKSRLSPIASKLDWHNTLSCVREQFRRLDLCSMLNLASSWVGFFGIAHSACRVSSRCGAICAPGKEVSSDPGQACGADAAPVPSPESRASRPPLTCAFVSEVGQPDFFAPERAQRALRIQGAHLAGDKGVSSCRSLS